MWLLILASILAGAAVSFAGLLGFVGLLIPHIARKFCGTNHKKLLPSSMICGSILVMICDTLGRTLAAPYEISVGILLSFIGGPFFVSLILLQRKGGFYGRD
jgi:iron complex transport system permease protein